MASTFKPNNIRYRFLTFEIKKNSWPRIFSFNLICIMGIVFLGEFVENDCVLAQEKQILKCPELGDPKTLEELKELRICLGKININKQSAWRMQNIRRSYEGSLELVEQLDLLMKNKTSKHLREESLNNNSKENFLESKVGESPGSE